MKIKCHGTRGWYKKKLKNSRLNIVHGIKRFFRDYCENTGLHGFRYIVTGETACHKIVWLMVCLAAIIFCVMLMLRLWQYYSNNPTVTIIDTSNPIRDLHFPGITICNNNKVYKPHADKIAQKFVTGQWNVREHAHIFIAKGHYQKS